VKNRLRKKPAMWAGILLITTLSADTGASKELAEGTLYMCDRTGPTVQVLVPDDQTKNPVLLLESEQFEMASVPEQGFAADLMLGPNHWIIRSKRPNELRLYKNQDAVKHCKVVSTGNTAERPKPADKVVSAMGNFSLGGRVRKGPGTNYQQIGSLSFGEPVVLQARSGVVMDGYEWFKILYGKGQIGYQWGGIMCSKALHITGLFAPCPAGIKQ
jgi:hypothetical protein